ncbi:hypothetical protein MA16_Dca006537 [Dendrobium catenatum]|uniref:Uncharacterized protein n=1 Tax=Dendrobium catenatum TaxID=906689 RepID=A0A2I0XGU1_9ASPA|nr:hypothetical protein MA16_Dca006537 [Dendrobium catenatum]
MKALCEDHFPLISVSFEARYLILMFQNTIGKKFAGAGNVAKIYFSMDVVCCISVIHSQGVLPNASMELELTGFAQVLILEGKFYWIVPVVVYADDVSNDSFAMGLGSFVIGKKGLCVDVSPVGVLGWVTKFVCFGVMFYNPVEAFDVSMREILYQQMAEICKMSSKTEKVKYLKKSDEVAGEIILHLGVRKFVWF